MDSLSVLFKIKCINRCIKLAKNALNNNNRMQTFHCVTCSFNPGEPQDSLNESCKKSHLDKIMIAFCRNSAFVVGIHLPVK